MRGVLRTYSHTVIISGFMAWGLAVLCWSPWLLPHNVLLNAQNAGQRASEHGLGSIAHTVPRFNMAVRVTSEHAFAQNARARIRAVHVIGLLHIEVVWCTSQSLHGTLFGAPRHVRIGIGCAMVVERWVLANEISIFSYVEMSALLM